MRLLKLLVVASLVAIALIEAWPHITTGPQVATRRPKRPHLPHLTRMRERARERIVAPIAGRDSRSPWR